MRPSRLIPILMVALTAAGCMHAPCAARSPARTAPRAAPPNLDSIAYERRVAPPSTAYAQAQPQQAQPRQAQPQPPAQPAAGRRRCRRTRSRAMPVSLRSRAGAGLYARYRRQAAHRRVRAGRPDQFLFRRRRRPGDDAADRRGHGARPHHRSNWRAPSRRSCAPASSASRMSRSRSRPIGRSSSSAR